MTPLHWAYALIPPVPDLPTNLTVPPLPLPVPVPRVRVRRSRLAPEPLLLADAAGQARVWFSGGASFDLIIALLNERCPQQPRWTRRAVRKLVMDAPREQAPAKIAA